MVDIIAQVKHLFARNKPNLNFKARQLMFSVLPPSKFVETYLYNNEGRIQNLDKFPMLRYIYDHLPERLLLKCSRKTLKSTFFSNIMTLNMIRWNYYKQLYVGNLEQTAKLFSSNYFMPRFDSPRIKEIISVGWQKDDVYEKVLADTQSSTLFKYCSEDATRVRGPATSENYLDEIQDIAHDQIPIIQETMALSEVKRERYAGTPLSTANTINHLWKKTNQTEWVTKCTACNHYNFLNEANDPLKMLLEHGYSCSKCSRVLNTSVGEWVAFNPSNKDFYGFHLAQPMLPFFNQSERGWADIYRKVQTYDEMSLYNEVLGLSYDSDTLKPITEESLRTACTLGPMYDGDGKLKIFNENKHSYRLFAVGVDWGVNHSTSRTVCVVGGVRDGGVIEIFFMKNFKNFDYESHIREIARISNEYNAVGAADSGPDPARGIKLIELTDPSRFQLIRYEHGNKIQHFSWPPGSNDWRQGRWCLHRSDTMGLMFRMIKQKRILFPRWEDVSDHLQDLLNVYIEVKDGQFRQEQFYRHDPDLPDDFSHATNFMMCTALGAIGDSNLTGASTSAGNA